MFDTLLSINYCFGCTIHSFQGQEAGPGKPVETIMCPRDPFFSPTYFLVRGPMDYKYQETYA